MANYRLLSWNVNGIRAIQKKGFLEWLTSDAPDMLCLQETKAHPDQLQDQLIHVPGYQAYFSSAERKGYSGVALYTKTEPIQVEYGLGHPEFDAEGRTLIAEYEKFFLFNIYYPNGKASKERLQYKMDFYKTFLEVANTYRDRGKGVIICGDMNTAHKPIDLARPRENEKVSGFLPMERTWIDNFLGNGYTDTFRLFNEEAGHYTWWDYKTRARERNVGWRIDYFFVSDNIQSNVKSAFMLKEVMGSDHCPLGIEITI